MLADDEPRDDDEDHQRQQCPGDRQALHGADSADGAPTGDAATGPGSLVPGRAGNRAMTCDFHTDDTAEPNHAATR